MSGSYLGRYFDSGLEIPGDATVATIRDEELARVGRTLAVVILASTLPRRLGGDAGDTELALDKRRARRVVHVLQNVWLSWAGKKAGIRLPVTDSEINREAAQLDWERFRDVHIAGVNSRARYAATWAILHDKERWGRSAIVMYENEIKWVTYALRD